MSFAPGIARTSAVSGGIGPNSARDRGASGTIAGVRQRGATSRSCCMVSAASHDADSCFAPRQVWLRGAQNARRATVSEMRLYALGRILAFAAALEVGTGLVLLIDPAVVVRLLLGAGDAGEATLLGRFFGHRFGCAGIGVLAEPGAGAEQFVGFSGYVDVQRADSAVPRLSRHVRPTLGLVVMARRCAARRRGAVTGLEVARRGMEQGDQEIAVAMHALGAIVPIAETPISNFATGAPFRFATGRWTWSNNRLRQLQASRLRKVHSTSRKTSG